MALAAQIAALTEDLIAALLPSAGQTRPVTPHAASEAALRSLRSHSFPRVNPFEVHDSLRGLEERFRINNRDALADALRNRLDALPWSSAKWLPDLLFLLLELSDRPTLKSRLSRLPERQQLHSESPPTFRWEEIAREDGWDQDPTLWETISYSNNSDSSDELYNHGSPKDSDTSSVSSDRPPPASLAQHVIYHPDDASLLDFIRKKQQWRLVRPESDHSITDGNSSVSEILIAREILFMLRGLECNLFDEGAAHKLPASGDDGIAHALQYAQLDTFAQFGRQLQRLRSFARQSQHAVQFETLQDCVSRRLQTFDSQLANIEARFLNPQTEVVVSLMALEKELAPFLEPLLALSSVISQTQDLPNTEAYRCLEPLVEATSMAQLTGDVATYDFLAHAFVDCLYVHLRPIWYWMREGKLPGGNGLSFVLETRGHVPLRKTWQLRFQLRRTADGLIRAPRFLQSAVGKIYSAGKNVVVLKLLGQHGAESSRYSDDEARLDYNTICPQKLEMAPFEELFSAALSRWVEDKHRETSSTLKKALIDEWGLLSALDAFQTLYLMSNGIAAAFFLDSLFSRLDDRRSDWHDDYALTAAAQDAFASLLDANRLSVSVDLQGQRLPVTEARESVRGALPSINIKYRLPWPVEMVLTDECVMHYQSLWTFLSQIKRGETILYQSRWLDKHGMGCRNERERVLFLFSRKRLLWFCTTLQTYITMLVIEPISQRMRRDLDEAEDVDAMIAVHTTALKQMVDQACLGGRLNPIREAILDILDLVIKLDDGRRQSLALGASGSSAYVNVLQDIEADFDKHLNFICRGLEGVARASNDASPVRWETLAEMFRAETERGEVLFHRSVGWDKG